MTDIGGSMAFAQDNKKGRTTAFGTVSEIRGVPWPQITRAVMTALRVFRPEQRAQQLAFLHYAHWIVIGRRDLDRLLRPRGGRARGAHLFFLSQFSGDWDDYLTAFSRVLDDAVDWAWRGVQGWPGATHLGAFIDYVAFHEIETQAFNPAYPDADAVEVRAALHVRDALERLVFEIEGSNDDAAVRRAYDRLLLDLRADLAD